MAFCSGSRRARSEPAEREATLERLSGIADADPDVYKAIVVGRIIVNPYIRDDAERFAAYVRELIRIQLAINYLSLSNFEFFRGEGTLVAQLCNSQ